MITTYNVVSSNGFIATKDGKEDFIPDEVWNDFLDLCTETYGKNGAVIIGRKTYDTIQAYADELIRPFEELPIKKIVLSRDNNFNIKKGYIVLHSLGDLDLLEEDNFLVSSGPDLNMSLLNNNLIDMVILNVLPISIKDRIKPLKTDISFYFANLTIEKKTEKRKFLIYRKDIVQQVTDLLNQANLLTHQMDRGVVGIHDKNYADKILTFYAGWKVKCIEIFFQDEVHPEYTEYEKYYNVFADSDGVSDMSYLALKNKELRNGFYNKISPLFVDNRNGEIVLGQWPISQMDLAIEGLRKRKGAMDNFLEELKSKKKGPVIVLHLDDEGLKRTRGNEELIYPIETTSDRHVILMSAIKGPTRPMNIKLKGKKKAPSIKKELNNTVKNLLKLNDIHGHEELVVNNGLGYEIDQKYEIIY
jgi:dihydrofolate reductase